MVILDLVALIRPVLNCKLVRRAWIEPCARPHAWPEVDTARKRGLWSADAAVSGSNDTGQRYISRLELV